ncbi:MAG: DUF2520 domain-containing protein, partial [Candidatus Dormibacterales bacterium]
LPLMRGVLDNLAREGLGGALTGPVARGDAETVRAHLAALRAIGEGVGPAAAEEPLPARVYRILGLVALELGESTGLPPQAAALIRAALTG